MINLDMLITSTHYIYNMDISSFRIDWIRVDLLSRNFTSCILMILGVVS